MTEINDYTDQVMAIFGSTDPEKRAKIRSLMEWLT